MAQTPPTPTNPPTAPPRPPGPLNPPRPPGPKTDSAARPASRIRAWGRVLHALAELTLNLAKGGNL